MCFLPVLQLLTLLYQSHSAPDATMVITAVSTVKVWLKDSKSQIKPADSSVVPPSPISGISMPQLVAILFVTILVNLCVTHYQTVARPCLDIVNSLLTMAQLLFTVCMPNLGEFNTTDALSQEANLNATGNSTVRGPGFSATGPMDT